MAKLNETTRVEAFSDGVFAIAITLLVLDIKVPHGAGSDGGLWQMLMAQWPTFAAYLTTFATIGIMWVNHHQLFTMIKKVDRSLMMLNGLLLLTVTFAPFPASLLAEYLNHPGEKTAAAVYSGLFVLIAIIFNLLWRYAAKQSGLIGKEIRPEDVAMTTKSYIFGPALYLLAFLLAWVSTAASVGLCAGMAIFYAIPRKTVG